MCKITLGSMWKKDIRENKKRRKMKGREEMRREDMGSSDNGVSFARVDVCGIIATFRSKQIQSNPIYIVTCRHLG